jgi:hypothetical protein
MVQSCNFHIQQAALPPSAGVANHLLRYQGRHRQIPAGTSDLHKNIEGIQFVELKFIKQKP